MDKGLAVDKKAFVPLTQVIQPPFPVGCPGKPVFRAYAMTHLSDFAFLAQYLLPYRGMTGLSDNGEQYVFDGFWKKLGKATAALATGGASAAVEKAKAKERAKKKSKKKSKSKWSGKIETSKAKSYLPKSLPSAVRRKPRKPLNAKMEKGGKIQKGIGLKKRQSEKAAKISRNLKSMAVSDGAGKVLVKISGDVRRIDMTIRRPITSRGKKAVPVSG